MESYALLLRLLPPVFLAWLTLVVLRSPYRSMANRLLGLFFALLAAEFSIEFLAAFTLKLSFPAGLFLQWVSSVIGLADPAVLLAFGLAFPDAARAVRSAWLWAAVALAAAGILLAELVLEGAWVGWLRTVYADGLYLVAFLFLLRSWLREPRGLRERPMFFVTLGVGFAAWSRVGGVLLEHPVEAVAHDPGLFYLSSLALEASLLVLVLAGLQAVAPRRPRRVWPLFAALAAGLLAFSTVHYLLGVASIWVGSQYFGLRWVAVACILGYGILRHQLFDFELRAWQAAVVLCSLAVGVLTAAAMAVAAGESRFTNAAMVSGFLVGLVAAGLAYALLDWVARRLLAGDDLPPRYQKRRVELYQTALAHALAGKPWTPAEHLFAETLREVFEISPEEHEEVMRRLQGPLPAAPP